MSCRFRVLICLLVCVQGLLCIESLAIGGVPEGYSVAGLQHDTCRWLCSDRGVFQQCATNEIAIGTCGSGDFAQCTQSAMCGSNDRAFTAIHCCTLRVIIASNDLVRQLDE